MSADLGLPGELYVALLGGALHEAGTRWATGTSESSLFGATNLTEIAQAAAEAFEIEVAELDGVTGVLNRPYAERLYAELVRGRGVSVLFKMGQTHALIAENWRQLARAALFQAGIVTQLLSPAEAAP